VEVAQDPLGSGEMGLPRGMHMQAHLLDGVGDVGPGEGEVLERGGQASVRCLVSDRGLVVLRELRLSVDRRGTGLAVGHAIPLHSVDGAAHGTRGLDGAACGAGRVDGAARGAGRGASGGVEATCGAGNDARRGAWGGGVTGSYSRRELRSMGGEEPTRGNTSSSKTT
jgi:hypothetical protein